MSNYRKIKRMSSWEVYHPLNNAELEFLDLQIRKNERSGITKANAEEHGRLMERRNRLISKIEIIHMVPCNTDTEDYDN